jgi:hypothetical protein
MALKQNVSCGSNASILACPPHVRLSRQGNLGHGLFAYRGEFVSWDQRFFDPITLPGRKPLVG